MQYAICMPLASLSPIFAVRPKVEVLVSKTPDTDLKRITAKKVVHFECPHVECSEYQRKKVKNSLKEAIEQAGGINVHRIMTTFR